MFKKRYSFTMAKKTHIHHLNFEKCTEQFMQDTFGLTYKKQLNSLKKWITIDDVILHKTEQEQLDELRFFAEERINAWNEGTLLVKLISPIINLSKLDSSKFATFAEVPLKTEFQTITNEQVELGGIVDMVYATGVSESKAPYFCMHEYKREKGNKADPRGQLLAEMLTAQQLNPYTDVMYGLYVNGRNWFFAALEKNRNYAFSMAYDTINTDIYDIVKILRKLRIYVEEKISTLPPNPKFIL